MGHAKNYTYWVWCDELGIPVYVGWGPYLRGKNYKLTGPDSVVFSKRFDYDSELNFWLRRYIESEPPTRNDEGVIKKQFFGKVDARTIAVEMRKRLLITGTTLLNPKPLDSMIGGGHSRVVSGPYGIFLSVRKAAAACNLDPATIVRLCQSGKMGWQYVVPKTPLELEENESTD